MENKISMKIVDMHCDTISEIYKSKISGKDSELFSNNLNIDINKMRAGGYVLQNFAAFVNMAEENNPYEYCKKLINCFFEEMNKCNQFIGQIKKYSDIENNIKNGKISALLSIEEGGVLKGSVDVLHEFYQAGVRMITLTWNYENGLGFPNFKYVNGKKGEPQIIPNFKEPETQRGLTNKGIEIVKEMENIGAIIDVSHLSDRGFYDVLDNTKKPFVASHSNSREICHNVRNMTDDMIRKLADRGGVMGINYCPEFVIEDADENMLPTTVKALVCHIKHIRNIGGIDVIGLGSDFDGIPNRLEMKDAGYMKLLVDELERESFTGYEIDKITYKNVLRVYKDIL